MNKHTICFSFILIAGKLCKLDKETCKPCYSPLQRDTDNTLCLLATLLAKSATSPGPRPGLITVVLALWHLLRGRVRVVFVTPFPPRPETNSTHRTTGGLNHRLTDSPLNKFANLKPSNVNHEGFICNYF